MHNITHALIFYSQLIDVVSENAKKNFKLSIQHCFWTHICYKRKDQLFGKFLSKLKLIICRNCLFSFYIKQVLNN